MNEESRECQHLRNVSPPRCFHSEVFGGGQDAGELSIVGAPEKRRFHSEGEKERWREVITQPELCGSFTV